MRRVGIVLGVLGGITGGVIGYSDLQNVWSSHTKFDRLQALTVMHDVATAIKAYHDASKIDLSHSLVPIPKGARLEPLDANQARGAGSTQIDYNALAKKYGGKEPSPGKVGVPLFDMSKAMPIQPGNAGVTLDFSKAQPIIGMTVLITPDKIIPGARKADVSDKIADPAADITVDVNNLQDIITVNADKAGAISSVQLTTGEWVHREPETFKARLAFITRLLLPFCYPVLGFLAPWGTIRVLTWVGSGFFSPPSSA